MSNEKAPIAGDSKAPELKRQRSPNYPAFGLPTAILKAQKIYELERTNAVHADILVKHLGFSGLTGASRRVVAALKTFGIMTEDDGVYKFTEDGLTVVMHGDGEEEVKAKLSRKPLIFQRISEKYPSGLPSDQTLKAYLVRDLKFVDEAADEVILALQETMQVAKPKQAEYTAGMQTPHPVGATIPPPPPPSLGSPAHVWWVGGGVRVDLRASAPLNPAQWAMLKKYVDLAAEADLQAHPEN